MGEPIVWVMSGVQVRETEEFHIDGQPALVLAIAPNEVWLRDPEPRSGFRKLEGAGYETTYRIVDVRMRVRDPSASRSVLNISIAGVVNVQHRLLLWLGNPSRDKIQLHCGYEPKVYRQWDHRLDREAMKWMWFEALSDHSSVRHEPAIFADLLEDLR